MWDEGTLKCEGTVVIPVPEMTPTEGNETKRFAPTSSMTNVRLEVQETDEEPSHSILIE